MASASPTAAPGERGCTVGVLADLFEVTPRRVQKMAQDGIIPKAARGLYPLVGSIKGYLRFLRRAAEGRTPDELAVAERQRLLRARREHVELMVRKLNGETVDLQRADRAVADLATEFRTAWENWPMRVAATLAAELNCDARQLSDVLEREVRDYLTTLADGNLVDRVRA